MYCKSSFSVELKNTMAKIRRALAEGLRDRNLSTRFALAFLSRLQNARWTLTLCVTRPRGFAGRNSGQFPFRMELIYTARKPYG